MNRGSHIDLFGIYFIAVCSLVFFVACNKNEAKKIEEKTVNIRCQPVIKQPLRPFIDALGTLNPNEEVTISAEIEGVLKSVKVDEGTPVSKGMLLATIDDTNYTYEVRRDEAALRQAEANLANTKLEFKRKDALYKEALVTQQQFDDVSTRLSLGESEIERTKALLSLARERLAKTKIYSPLSCVVKEKKVSMGDFVKNGTPLFSIIQTNPLKLNFAVPEKDVGKLKVNQDVLLKVDGFPDREFRGRVNLIYPHVDEKTRTLTVEALVPNDSGTLKPGLFAKVTLYTGADKNTVVVPVTSLLYEEERVKVFVIEGDRARERQVKLGSKYGEMMEIAEGLKGGETVAVSGQANLSDGVKVAIQGQASPEKPQPAAAGPETGPNNSDAQTKGGTQRR
jgi:membrane fusion protein (multidrug efflux system)